MTTYKAEALAVILREMADYLTDNCNQSEYAGYFQEIVQTGLFHDAIGKPVEISENSVTVITDY